MQAIGRWKVDEPSLLPPVEVAPDAAQYDWNGNRKVRPVANMRPSQLGT